jgi:type III secretion protein R
MLLAATPPATSIAQSPESFGVLLGILAVMSIVPFVLTLTTSFAKFVIVLGLIRQALGTQQTPPNMIITGIALILTIHVMWPVGEQAYANYQRLEAEAPAVDPTGQDSVSFDRVVRAIRAVHSPMHDFLVKHSDPIYVEQFASLDGQLDANPEAGESTLRSDLKKRYPEAAAAIDDLIVYAPAFLLSELTEAFQIGFLIFVPFLVIDLVVGNVLLAMGMQMLTPQTIALPLKLLLFVVIDGWRLVLTGLVSGYA